MGHHGGARGGVSLLATNYSSNVLGNERKFRVRRAEDMKRLLAHKIANLGTSQEGELSQRWNILCGDA